MSAVPGCFVCRPDEHEPSTECCPDCAPVLWAQVEAERDFRRAMDGAA